MNQLYEYMSVWHVARVTSLLICIYRQDQKREAGLGKIASSAPVFCILMFDGIYKCELENCKAWISCFVAGDYLPKIIYQGNVVRSCLRLGKR